MELRLRNRLFITTLLVLCFVPSAAASVLGRNIESRIRQSELQNAFWAIHVEDEQGRVIYSKNSDKLVIPASVRKLFSAATIANCRGFDHRYRTELWLEGTIDNGVLHGNLVIRGAGDPSMGSRYVRRTTDIFEPWVAAVKAAGITVVNGGVVSDASMFDGVFYPGSWKHDNIGQSYAPPIDALAFNENGVGVFMTAHGCSRYWVATDPWFVPVLTDTNCTDRRLMMTVAEENVLMVEGNPGKSKYGELFTTLRSVTEPSLYAAQALHSVLEESGIRALAEPRVTKNAPSVVRQLAVIESPPLSTLLGTMLETSSNLFAEMMYKSVSNELPASWSGAHSVERDFLENVVGIDGQHFSFDDGSGLAVENYVTARATVDLLQWMTEPSRRGAWEELLAAPEDPGTLRRRLRSFRGRLWGKTGTLDGARALAGYLVRQDGELRYFSIFVNHYATPAWQAGQVIDQIVHEIDLR